MTRHEYALLDVFTDRKFGGNPLAVFRDGAAVPERAMQPIAKELNLSETTFVLPPEKGGTHRVRIFTPGREMPFAGHPTVGTAFVLSAGNDAAFTFELGVGPVAVRVTGGFGQMEQPLPKFGDISQDRDAVANGVGLVEADIDPTAPLQVVSSGVPFRFVRLRTLAGLRRARPLLPEDDTYLFTTETVEPASAVHGRMFGSRALGIAEDPATGGTHGPLGAYLVRNRIVPPGTFRSEQGFEMGRPSILTVEVDGTPEAITGVRVGGNCVTVGGGWMDV